MQFKTKKPDGTLEINSGSIHVLFDFPEIDFNLMSVTIQII